MRTIFKKWWACMLIALFVFGQPAFLLFPARTSAVFGVGDISFDPTNFVQNTSTAISSGTEVGLKIKDIAIEALKQVAMGVARKAMQKMTESTVNWISTGMNGDPFFVQNSKTFYDKVGDTQIKALVNKIGYDSTKYPYGKDVAQTVISGYVNDKKSAIQPTTIDPKTAGTFTGWDTWFKKAANPSNDPIGTLLDISDNAQNAVTEKKQESKDEVTQGGGYVAQKSDDCLKYAEPEPASCDATSENCTNEPAPEPVCLERKTVTPPRSMGDSYASALQANGTSTAISTQIGNGIAGWISSFVTQLFDQGLSSTKTKGIGTGSNTTDDNWSYAGLNIGTDTAGGIPTSSAIPIDWTKTPDKVVDLSGELGLTVMTDPDTGATLPSAIQRTQDEIDMHYDIISKTQKLPTYTQALDQCLPGPDYGWEQRFREALQQAEKPLNQIATGDDDDAKDAIKDLKRINSNASLTVFNINQFMLTHSVPSGVSMLNQVKNAGSAGNDVTREQNTIQKKTGTLELLKSMKKQLQNGADTNTVLAQYLAELPNIPTVESNTALNTELQKVQITINGLVDAITSCKAGRSDPAVKPLLEGSTTQYQSASSTTQQTTSSSWTFLTGGLNTALTVADSTTGDTYTMEVYNYCQKILSDGTTGVNGETTTTNWIGASYNIDVSCNDFFYSTPADYPPNNSI